jgi:hypothetical protein
VTLAVPRLSRAAGIPGYWDTTASKFVPMRVPKVAAKDPVTRTGTVDLDITLTLESAIGADEEVYCNASISTSDASFDNEVSAFGIVSGRPTGTLTLTMPYDWTMAATGESAQIFLSCTEYDGGTVEHEMSFASVAFVVPATTATTTEHFTGSL